MHTRCPRCRNPVELVDDETLAEVSCPSCGSSFSLVGTGDTLDHVPTTIESLGHFTLSDKLARAKKIPSRNFTAGP